MTEIEKTIYNKHLAVSRSLRKKSFKLKKDFTGFEDDERYPYIKRIAILFGKYPEIDMNLYFIAPYKLYPDVEYFDLQYFSSLRAIKSYSLYKNELEKLAPEQHISDVKKSLGFITKYCIENKISLDKYINNKTQGMHPDWMYHLKLNKINIYTLMEFPNLLEYISEIPEDEQFLFFGATYTDFFDKKIKYLNSPLKPFLKLAIKKISAFIKNTLKK